jgi:2-oxoglutarate ferredoxin oxidoreductase subunit beta
VPGCGDYAILATVQGFMPELGLRRENVVFVSASAARRGSRTT